MSLTGNSHPILTRGCRVSRAPPHQTLPASINLHGRSLDPAILKIFYFKKLRIVTEGIPSELIIQTLPIFSRHFLSRSFCHYFHL